MWYMRSHALKHIQVHTLVQKVKARKVSLFVASAGCHKEALLTKIQCRVSRSTLRHCMILFSYPVHGG